MGARVPTVASCHRRQEARVGLGLRQFWTGLPTTLPRSVILLLGVLGVVAMGIGIKAAAGIIAPTMLAIVLTFAVLPIDRWARRHRWPGGLATLTALVAAYLILLVMVVGTVVCLIKFADLLPSYAAEAKDLTKSAQGDLAQLGAEHGRDQ